MKKTMNTPNKLTIFRILLVPLMVIIFLINTYIYIPGEILGIPLYAIILDILFIIGSITDKIDGYLARKNNEVTTFGKFLDPIADKILVISAMIILVEMKTIPSWIPIIIITREFAVSGYRLIAVEKKGNVIAANKWGKIKTVTQMIAIIIAFLDKYGFGKFIFRVGSIAETYNNSAGIYMTMPQLIINIAMTVFMVICVIATIFSGYEYLKGGKDLLKD